MKLLKHLQVVFNDCIMIKGEGQTNFIGDSEIGSIGIKITSEEWYSKKVGLIKMIRRTNRY